MKVRWREHEAVLISMIAAFTIVNFVIQMLRLSPQQMAVYAAPYIHDHKPFSYFFRILLPQIGAVLAVALIYIFADRVSIPFMAKPGRSLVVKFAAAVAQIILIAYITGPLGNFASYYIDPWYRGDGFFLSLIYGFHPQPFINSFGGFDSSLFLVLVCTAYFLFREATIRYFEADSPIRPLRISILNQVTMFLLVLFELPAFTAIFGILNLHLFYVYYFAFSLPMEAAFLTNIYLLFPRKGDRPFLNWQFMGPLLFITFIFSLGFSVTLGEHWSLLTVLAIWAMCVFFMTPVSWLDYQQRKDKILQLRGTQKALVRSTADLHFLRSQINPHFLFNALNTLYGTALIEGSKNTAEGIQRLGDMMRFMLHENTMDLIPMEKETEYLVNYIALQKLRTQLSPDILIEDNIGSQNCDQKIAPMLLIPFVENAFKHGVNLTERSWIKIKLDCDAEHISFEVRNSVHASTANDPEKEHSGIGLKNVQDRLAILYKGKHEFTYGVQGNEYVAKLKLEPVTRKHFKKQVNLNWIKNA